MNDQKIIFKKATINDKNEIAKVLLDFYNMNDFHVHAYMHFHL